MDNEFQDSLIDNKWVRVDNFPILMQSNLIDEFGRLHLINNTVLRLNIIKND